MDSNSSKNNGSKSPYEILGVKEGAAFEDIQKARDIKVKEAGEDLILKAKIESSFDQSVSYTHLTLPTTTIV